MEEEILAFALQNAVDHGGKANIGPVMGKAMALYPDLKKDPKKTSEMVRGIVEVVNSLTVDEQKARLERIGGPIELGKKERKTGLPDLKGAGTGRLVMRFAPGPSGPLHIGHTRAAVLNDEYCRKYEGKFILRLEDTNPEKIEPEAYRMIPEDLEWLGIRVDETVVQSDRFDTYYDVTRKLIEAGAAYVCTIDTEVWRELKLSGKPCEERDQPPGVQMEKWERMLDGTYAEGEASLVIKTDLQHRNPAVRDFVGMRIKEGPHPRTGDRYRVYPLYNLSVAIDDHLMGCTHILRGKDHLNNTLRQEYVYRHLGWELPGFIHYGLVSIPESILKTSLIKEEIRSGNFSGWADVRLGTLQALAARGFDPASLREYWIEVGIKSVDINFSWETLYAKNRSLVDGRARRFFFVPEPAKLRFEHEGVLIARSPVHPERPELGDRVHEVPSREGIITVQVPGNDLKDTAEGAMVRLKDLCNVKVTDASRGNGEFAGKEVSTARGEKIRIVQWVSEGAEPLAIYTPDGDRIDGLAESGIGKKVSEGDIVQFERVGYCRIFRDNGLKANMTHP